MLWTARHILEPWTHSQPHTGAFALAFVQSAADVCCSALCVQLHALRGSRFKRAQRSALPPTLLSTRRWLLGRYARHPVVPCAAFILLFALQQTPFDSCYGLPLLPGVAVGLGLSLLALRAAAPAAAIISCLAVVAIQPVRAQ
jgi:hypothetical protein